MPRVTGQVDGGAGAFVQLQDATGDFVGEVRADEGGGFTFHATPGRWVVVCLLPGRRRGEREIELGNEDLHVRVPVSQLA